MGIVICLCTLLSLILSLLYKWLTKNNSYFHDKPFPSMTAKPLFGSTGPLILKKYSPNGFVEYIYKKFQNEKVFGLFDARTPIFVLRDPELIKKVTIKDFDHFVDHRPTFGNSENDNPDSIFGKTLFSLNGQKWRDMRATLSPAFTGSKMRKMFELIMECSDSVVQYFLQQSGQSLEVELTDLGTRFGADVIASCAFGIEIDSQRNRHNDFYDNGKKMMQFERLRVALVLLGFKFCPTLLGRLGVDVVDREQARYFSGLIQSVISERLTKGIVRHDMIHLLLQARSGALKHQNNEEEIPEEFVGAKTSMTDNEMVSQAFIFFVAGFETVSNTLTFLLYDIVVNPNVQQKLFEEIRETQESLDGKSLNYDTLQKMKYLDMVLSESMRLRPVVPFIDRLCVRDYILQDGEGLKFTINKGTAVWIPIQGLHLDPKFFPSPEKFDPERFSDENRANLNPMTFLPFGLGPRNCTGARFALMEIKAIVYHLLLHFSLEMNERTPVPLELRKGFTVASHSEGDVYITLKKRSR